MNLLLHLYKIQTFINAAVVTVTLSWFERILLESNVLLQAARHQAVSYTSIFMQNFLALHLIANRADLGNVQYNWINSVFCLTTVTSYSSGFLVEPLGKCGCFQLCLRKPLKG